MEKEIKRISFSELKNWKERIDEVASPSQLKELQVQVDELKSFKTQAVTVFAVVQFGMAAVLFFAEFM